MSVGRRQHLRIYSKSVSCFGQKRSRECRGRSGVGNLRQSGIGEENESYAWCGD